MKIAFTILIAISHLEALSQTKSWETPFLIENNGIYIYCKVNDIDSVRFLFDTGADGSVINTDSNKQIKLKVDGESMNEGSNGTNKVSQSNNNLISFSEFEQKNVSFTLIPFGTTDFDGVFGTNLMKNYVIEINYDRKTLKFTEHVAFNADLSSYDKINIHFVNNYPTISSTLVIQGKKITGFFGLDTGASDALTIASPYERKHDFKHKTDQIATATFQGSDGSSYEMAIVRAPELKVEKKSFYSIPMNLSTAKEGIDATEKMAGFFGNNFLKRFNTVLDLKNGFIYLKVNENLYLPFFE
ncbi:retropepsin-like aspartic protease [Fluviicola taffensis]|uniref:Peptidase A2 domain-containing protein n=1 Tax=Fluviicola taffensis (strain DSM 16823 / NCIMB 13979 / RW262) TaxID=755732 RepID=F2ID76_FLUTR|nr:retropepsin-like aspartic protease [Fluviicola taffensis]AEA45491.1 hypothetical protein Fluta_3522 [Fluviicola taffensis DSM 16823]